MPVFMKAGCNMGSCHGAARGKDGFRLSLFGFDPDGDHFRLTREISGRRINLALPDESLMIEKPAGKVPAHGRQAIRRRKRAVQHAHSLAAKPAPLPIPAKCPRSFRSSCIPRGRCSTANGLDAEAHRARQVLRRHRPRRHLAGVLHVEQRNLGHRLAGRSRRRRKTVAKPSSWPASKRTPWAASSSCCPRGCSSRGPSTPEFNYIDELVHNKLRKLRIAPSDVCSDDDFLRRVYIDIDRHAAHGRRICALHARSRPQEARATRRRAAEIARNLSSCG